MNRYRNDNTHIKRDKNRDCAGDSLQLITAHYSRLLITRQRYSTASHHFLADTVRHQMTACFKKWISTCSLPCPTYPLRGKLRQYSHCTAIHSAVIDTVWGKHGMRSPVIRIAVAAGSLLLSPLQCCRAAQRSTESCLPNISSAPIQPFIPCVYCCVYFLLDWVNKHKVSYSNQGIKRHLLKDTQRRYRRMQRPVNRSTSETSWIKRQRRRSVRLSSLYFNILDVGCQWPSLVKVKYRLSVSGKEERKRERQKTKAGQHVRLVQVWVGPPFSLAGRRKLKVGNRFWLVTVLLSVCLLSSVFSVYLLLFITTVYRLPFSENCWCFALVLLFCCAYCVCTVSILVVDSPS